MHGPHALVRCRGEAWTSWKRCGRTWRQWIYLLPTLSGDLRPIGPAVRLWRTCTAVNLCLASSKGFRAAVDAARSDARLVGASRGRCSCCKSEQVRIWWYRLRSSEHSLSRRRARLHERARAHGRRQGATLAADAHEPETKKIFLGYFSTEIRGRFSVFGFHCCELPKKC